jgi:integrase
MAAVGRQQRDHTYRMETGVTDPKVTNREGIIRELGDLPADAVISEESLAKIPGKHRVSITGKAMAERPIPEQMMTELSNHVASLPDEQERLFHDRFSPKKWERVRKAVGAPELKFHDLRKTFAFLLAQRGVSTAVTQRLLEHSSPQLTNEVYTNVAPVLRQAVDLLPVADWV